MTRSNSILTWRRGHYHLKRKWDAVIRKKVDAFAECVPCCDWVRRMGLGGISGRDAPTASLRSGVHSLGGALDLSFAPCSCGDCGKVDSTLIAGDPEPKAAESAWLSEGSDVAGPEERRVATHAGLHGAQKHDKEIEGSVLGGS